MHACNNACADACAGFCCDLVSNLSTGRPAGGEPICFLSCSNPELKEQINKLKGTAEHLHQQ